MNSNPEMVLRYRSQNPVRCAVCGLARNSFYKQTIGGDMFNFCSGAHLKAAQDQYAKRKNSGMPVEVETIDSDSFNFLPDAENNEELYHE